MIAWTRTEDVSWLVVITMPPGPLRTSITVAPDTDNVRSNVPGSDASALPAISAIEANRQIMVSTIPSYLYTFGYSHQQYATLPTTELEESPFSMASTLNRTAGTAD